MFFYRGGAILDKAVGALPKQEIERRVRALL